MNPPLPTNDHIEAAKAIGAVLAARPGTSHAFGGRFAVSLLRAWLRPDVNLRRPLPPPPVSAIALGVPAHLVRPEPVMGPLSLVVDHHTNVPAQQEETVGVADYIITTQLVINGGDHRLVVPDPARAVEGDHSTFFFKDDNSSTWIEFNHASVDYENQRLHPRYPSQLSLAPGQQHVLHIPVTGGVTIPVLHPSLLIPELIYNARSTPEYKVPRSLAVIIGIETLLRYLDDNNQRIDLAEYVFPRDVNTLDFMELVGVFEKQNAVENEIIRLRNWWVTMITKLRTAADERERLVMLDAGERYARERIFFGNPPIGSDLPRTSEQESRLDGIESNMQTRILAIRWQLIPREHLLRRLVEMLDRTCGF